MKASGSRVLLHCRRSAPHYNILQLREQAKEKNPEYTEKKCYLQFPMPRKKQRKKTQMHNANHPKSTNTNRRF